MRDAANYYGLGERFDTLNHAHTVVENSSQDNGHAKGSSTYKPIPFFMSTTGYGLWVDTTAEATFDMNATSESEIIVDVRRGEAASGAVHGAGVPEDSRSVYGAGRTDRFCRRTGRLRRGRRETITRTTRR